MDEEIDKSKMSDLDKLQEEERDDEDQRKAMERNAMVEDQRKAMVAITDFSTYEGMKNLAFLNAMADRSTQDLDLPEFVEVKFYGLDKSFAVIGGNVDVLEFVKQKLTSSLETIDLVRHFEEVPDDDSFKEKVVNLQKRIFSRLMEYKTWLTKDVAESKREDNEEQFQKFVAAVIEAGKIVLETNKMIKRFHRINNAFSPGFGRIGRKIYVTRKTKWIETKPLIL